MDDASGWACCTAASWPLLPASRRSPKEHGGARMSDPKTKLLGPLGPTCTAQGQPIASSKPACLPACLTVWGRGSVPWGG